MALFSDAKTLRSAGRDAAFGLFLLCVTFIAYIPAMQGGYIWDDDDYILDNPTLKTTHGLRDIWLKPLSIPQYYPLVHTTFWLEYQIWLATNPFAFHRDNVLLHVLVAFLAWIALRRLKVPGAWLAAAVFALHPVHVESVAWITERKNVLSGVFYLLSLLAYLRFERLDEEGVDRAARRWPHYFLSLLLFLAALLSKTVTCSLPAILLLIYWWKRGWPEGNTLRVQLVRFGRIVWPTVPFFILGAGMSLVTVWMEKHHVGTDRMEFFKWTPLDRILIASRGPWFYFYKLIWPTDLAFFYTQWEFGPRVWKAFLFPIAGLATLLTLWFKRATLGRGPLAAVMFFVLTLVPALGFVDIAPLRLSVVADHFQYLASLGIITLVTSFFYKGWFAELPRYLNVRRYAVAVALLWTLPLGVLLALGTLTWKQGYIYKDQETLWVDTLKKNPTSYGAHVNLGVIRMAQGKPDEAIAQYHLALKSNPTDAIALNNLGETLASLDRNMEAMDYYHQALEKRPHFVHAWVNLGILKMKLGQIDEAVGHFQKALTIKPDAVIGHYYLGRALEKQGRLPEAIAHYEEVLRIRDDLMEPRMALEAAREKMANSPKQP